MKPFYNTEYGIAFSIMSRSSCYNCQFKSLNHKSDITIGDYWGLRPGNKKEWNDEGVSIAFVRTEIGDKLISDIRDICVVNETDTEFAMSHNTLMNVQKQKNPFYDTFVTNFHDYGLYGAVKKRYSFGQKCVLFIKHVLIKVFPQPLKNFIKNIMSAKS